MPINYYTGTDLHAEADEDYLYGYAGNLTCPHGDRIGWCDRGGCDEYYDH